MQILQLDTYGRVDNNFTCLETFHSYLGEGNKQYKLLYCDSPSKVTKRYISEIEDLATITYVGTSYLIEVKKTLTMREKALIVNTVRLIRCIEDVEGYDDDEEYAPNDERSCVEETRETILKYSDGLLEASASWWGHFHIDGDGSYADRLEGTVQALEIYEKVKNSQRRPLKEIDVYIWWKRSGGIVWSPNKFSPDIITLDQMNTHRQQSRDGVMVKHTVTSSEDLKLVLRKVSGWWYLPNSYIDGVLLYSSFNGIPMFQFPCEQIHIFNYLTYFPEIHECRNGDAVLSLLAYVDKGNSVPKLEDFTCPTTQ